MYVRILIPFAVLLVMFSGCETPPTTGDEKQDASPPPSIDAGASDQGQQQDGSRSDAG